LVIKGPGVIEALKGFSVATALTADLRPTVRAGVQQDPHRAIAAAYQDDGTASHTPRSKIPWLGDLLGVARVEPALLENALLFERHDLGVSERAAMHAKQPVLTVVQHQVIERCLFHRVLL